MNAQTALYILDRLFGCWLGRHLWEEWEEDIPKRAGFFQTIERRGCSMAACQRQQFRYPGDKKWEDLP